MGWIRVSARVVAVVALALLLGGSSLLERWLAPAAEPWERWRAHGQAGGPRVDHEPWSRFLREHVVAGADGIHRIAYGRVSEDAWTRLEAYVEALAAVPISRLARTEQLPYWINLYNALTVRLILDHYPVATIRDITDGFFSFGPWERKLIEVEDVALSLSDIEHRILRPLWNDPRIHYAVNCASLGCPNLQATAFTPSNTEALLDESARGYIAHPRGARETEGRLIVSSIYNWFNEDFGGSDTAVLDHLRRLGGDSVAELLRGREEIDAYEYDWRLNDLTEQ